MLDVLTLSWIICGGIVAVAAYAKALAEAKAGRLVVYCDWRDCLISSAWIVLVPLGFCWFFDSSAEQPLRIGGAVLMGLGVWSFVLLVVGAFKYNRGGRAGLSLYARLAVSLLILLSVGKLNELFQNYKRGQYGRGGVDVVQGVLIPVALVFAVFNWLIRPMIGSGGPSKSIASERRRKINLKGVIMDKAQKLTEFLHYLKDQLPLGGRISAEDYYSQGLRYYKGSGVKRDLHLAFVCFEHAAKKGLREAQYRVGQAYDSGNGVSEDKFLAFKCEKDKYICNEEVRKAVRIKMDAAIEKRDRSFGNARFVRNFYEEAQRRIASRLAGKLSRLTDAELKTFATTDFA